MLVLVLGTGHGRDMDGIWTGHGRDMDWTWTGHGRDMDGTWTGHGRAMDGTWTSRWRVANVLTTFTTFEAELTVVLTMWPHLVPTWVTGTDRVTPYGYLFSLYHHCHHRLGSGAIAPDGTQLSCDRLAC